MFSKRSYVPCILIFMLLFESFFGIAQITFAAENSGTTVTNTDQSIIDLGTPVQEAQTIDAVYGQENGANVVYTTVTGSASSGDWARFNVIDIDNQRLINSYPLEGASNSWSHVITPDGRVYIGASNKMFVYSPETKEVIDLGIPIHGTSSIWSLTSDPDGNVYGGIYSASIGGQVFKIDADTLTITNLLGEAVDNNEDYIRSIAYYDGHVYAGTGSTNGRVFKINAVTKEVERIELPGSPEDDIYQGKYNQMGFVYGMKVVGDYLFAFFNGPSTMHVYDLNKQEWREKGLTNIRGLMAVTGEHNGNVYTNKKDGNMWEIDVETLEERVAMPFDGSIRNSKWMDVKNQPDFDGPVMVTISYDGKVILSDPATNTRISMRSLVEGQAINLQAMESGPDGKVYISSYMGTKGAIYDPENNDALSLFNLGQAEGFGSVGDTMYAGVYPGAKIFGWDTNESIDDIEPSLLFDVGEKQDRPFVLKEGGGKLLIGTIPDYAEHGGALTVYDPKESEETGEPVFDVYRNIVENQSVAGLAYKDGIVFGSTTIHGGLGADPIASKAKLFAWDMESKTKIHEWDLELDGLSNTVPMITGLTVGTDGYIWGVANGFVFAFDPDTYEVVKSKNVYPAVTNYGRWRPMKQYWGLDGLLYTNVADTLTVINPETMESKKLVDNVTIFSLTNENDIYFSQATRVFKKLAEKPENIRLTAPNTLTVHEPEEMLVEADFYGWTVDVTDKVDFEISDPALIQIENGSIIPKKAGEVTINMSYMGTTLPAHTITIKDRDPVKSYVDIENADFESDLVDGEIPGWSVRIQDEHTTIGLSQNLALSGENSISLKDATTAGYAALQSDLLEVEPGKTYTAGVNVYLDDPLKNPGTGNDYSSSRTMYQVRYYDENQNELGDYQGLGTTFEHPRGEWMQGEFTFTPHNDVRYIRVLLTSSIAWVSNVYYDDVYVYSETLPSILDVAELDDIAVDYGTKKDNISLPSTANVTLNNGDTVNVAVSWDDGNPAYDGQTVGSYTFTGTLDTSLNNPEDVKATINVIVKPEEVITVRSVEKLSDITVVQGTKEADINLPSTIKVTFSNGTTMNVDVRWNGSEPIYNGENFGTYTFTGSLETDIENPNGITASIQVIVEEEGQIDPEIPVKVYLDIENADFESDLVDSEIPGWSVRIEDEHTSLELTQEQALSGQNSVSLMDATTSGYAVLQSDLLEVEPGKEYAAGVSVYLGEPLKNPITGNDFSSSRTMYQVRYFDAEGKELSDYLGLGTTFEHPRGEWIQGEFTFTPHENVRYIRVLLSSSIAWVSNAYYDDVYVYSEELPNIVEVEELADVSVEYGTERSDIELPSTIKVSLNNGDTTNVDVIWDDGEPMYDGLVSGTYTFTGRLDTNISNLDELVAVVNITVLEKEEEEPTDPTLAELSGQLEEYIESGEVSGPLVNQLRNSLKQAEHHLNKGSNHKASNFVEKFLKHLNNKPMQKHINEEAKVDLASKAESLINYWMN